MNRPAFRGKMLRSDRAAVMAIINRTPDSFYDNGALWDSDVAMAAVDQAVTDGADILDIGGVKAGVGATVSVSEEIRRVVPFLEAVRSRYPSQPISVDTYRAEVARAALAAGADLINDTWAAYDPALADVAAEYGAGMVCSHTGGADPRTNPVRARYADVVAAVIADTTAAASRMIAAGIPADGILIDPTHDFGKNTHHGLELLRRCDELVGTGWPVLMALSRKDFVGETLNRPVDQRLPGTLAATALAAAAGVAVFRAHDVAATVDVLAMVASVIGDRPPARAQRGLV